MPPLTQSCANANVVLRLKPQCSEQRLAFLDVVLPEHMPEVEQWHPWEAERFLGAHLGHGDRFKLFLYLTGNGFPPFLWEQWAKAQPGWLRWQESVLDLATLMKRFKEGKLADFKVKQIRPRGADAWEECLGYPAFLNESEQRRAWRTYPKDTRPLWLVDGHCDAPPPACSMIDDAITSLKQYALTLPREPKSY